MYFKHSTAGVLYRFSFGDYAHIGSFVDKCFTLTETRERYHSTIKDATCLPN